MTKIVGIVLVKNEDIYIQTAIENVVDFCDSLILLDNNSTDKTYCIMENIQKKFPHKIQLQRLPNALLSHKFIEGFANTNTWIFAVDGDEIYDKNRLAEFKTKILAGEYNSYWKIFGNCIHVESTQATTHTIYGYMTPPSRSITKLYNFNAIYQWEEHSERLHGTNMKFKEGFNSESVYLLHDLYSWDNSLFRCIHMCFVKRSTLDKKSYNTRLNPLENLKPYFKIVNVLRNIFNGELSLQSSYKIKKYKRGKIAQVDSSDFFSF